jgi:ABC-type multidrug transport system fused ATPase/permease subunit
MYILGWCMSCLEFAIAFITPFMYRQLVEIVTYGRGTQAIWTVLLLFAALLLLTPMICIGTYLRFKAAAIGVGNIQKIVFDHLQHQPVQKTIENKKGDYINRLSNDSNAAGIFSGYAFTNFFKFLVFFIASFVILATIHPLLLGISIGFSIISFIAATKLNPKARALEQDARRYTSGTASYLIEAFRCMPIIRVFLLKDHIAERYHDACKIIKQKRVSYRTLLGAAWAVSNIFSYAVEPIGFIVGIGFIIDGRMDIAQVVFAASIMAIMAEGMRQFGIFMQFIQSGLVANKRIFELLDDPVEADRKTIFPANPDADNAIVIQDLRFAYPTGGEILKGIDLTVRVGESLAIVGGSGGGKTTLLKILLALYEKTSGNIKLFDAPVEDLSLADIRRLSSYVQQDCFLFDGTIAENISMGLAYTQEEIMEAARKANIHDFIASLPDGYDTMVGERGTLVSGGQKQRITIARAILKNAPILFLDEATAALDTQAEIEVHAALEELTKDKTTLIIAHRLSTIQNADRIIVIENGSIVEEGKHDDLILRNGVYKNLLIHG